MKAEKKVMKLSKVVKRKVKANAPTRKDLEKVTRVATKNLMIGKKKGEKEAKKIAREANLVKKSFLKGVREGIADAKKKRS